MTKKDVEMAKVENQVVEDAAKKEKKAHKSSFDTRVKTAVIEALHLTKVVRPVCLTRVVRRKNEFGKREMKVETYYTFEAYVLDENSPYSGTTAPSYSEQDAMNKLNDVLFIKAKTIDELLYRQTIDKLNAKKGIKVVINEIEETETNTNKVESIENENNKTESAKEVA